MESCDSDEIILISKHNENINDIDTENDSDIECKFVNTNSTHSFPKRKAAVAKKPAPKKIKKKVATSKKTNKKSNKKEQIETPQIENETKTLNKVVPIMVKPENVKKNRIICRDGENEKIYYLNNHDTLEPLYDGLSQEAKLIYKGMYVSKFLTLEELDFTEGENIFEIIGNKKKMMNIKINLDFNKSTSLNVPEEMKVCEVFKLFDSLPNKENILVINGYILDESKLLRDIIEDEDVIDYI